MLVRRVIDPDDVELLREIRNSCREYMTHDTHHVTREQQADWWAAAPRRAYLYNGVAFSYVSTRDGKPYITLGMLPEARGQGLGPQIYRHVAELLAPLTVWADVNHSNVPSINAAARAGWKIAYVDGSKVVMHS